MTMIETWFSWSRIILPCPHCNSLSCILITFHCTDESLTASATNKIWINFFGNLSQPLHGVKYMVKWSSKTERLKPLRKLQHGLGLVHSLVPQPLSWKKKKKKILKSTLTIILNNDLLMNFVMLKYLKKLHPWFVCMISCLFYPTLLFQEESVNALRNHDNASENMGRGGGGGQCSVWRRTHGGRTWISQNGLKRARYLVFYHMKAEESTMSSNDFH